MFPTIDITPFLALLGLMTATILLVWGVASVYFKFKQNAFWASFEEGEPETDEERAAYDQYDKPCVPEGTDIEFDPEGDPTAGPTAGSVEVAKDAAEMVAVYAKKDREAKQQSLDYDRIPTGTRFLDLDGNYYKFVEHPWAGGEDLNGKPIPAGKRVKLKLTGAVTNDKAIPTPTYGQMEAITKAQAIETVENVDGNVLAVDPNDETCEICGVGTEHAHSGGEVRRVIGERAESKFKTYVANLDLTKLPAEEVGKLWSRCKLRLETDAALSAMVEMDNLFARAQKLAQEDAEDEAFFQQTLKEREAGPIVVEQKAVLDTMHPEKCGFEVPNFAPCTRDYGHEGPCALPAYAKYCGNCVDLFPEDRTVENCGCGMDLSPNGLPPENFSKLVEEHYRKPKKYEAPAQSVPIEMPKRYMSAITRQDAEDSVVEGVRVFGNELAEDVPAEDQHKVWGAVGHLMQQLQEDEPAIANIGDLTELYDGLTTEDLGKHAEAMLVVAELRAADERAAKKVKPKKAKKKAKKKPAKKPRRK